MFLWPKFVVFSQSSEKETLFWGHVLLASHIVKWMAQRSKLFAVIQCESRPGEPRERTKCQANAFVGGTRGAIQCIWQFLFFTSELPNVRQTWWTHRLSFAQWEASRSFSVQKLWRQENGDLWSCRKSGAFWRKLLMIFNWRWRSYKSLDVKNCMVTKPCGPNRQFP